MQGMQDLEVYLVGGAVRDSMLGLTPLEKDWVVVGATPERMMALGFRPVGKDFPVFLHPETGEQYALARTERKTGRGYTGFATHHAPDVTLEEDLGRRDLTINAMARAKDGTLIDPYGGARDLEARQLRHVSAAFVEDPLRVLRVARFAARFAPLGFSVAPETLDLMRRIVADGELEALVAERVWAETQRALAEREPRAFFEVLRSCDALPAVFPELAALYGVPQPPRWHPEVDTGLHAMLALEAAAQLSPEVSVRFAALVHDLGKALTPRKRWPSHHGHEEAGVAVIEQLCARLKVPAELRELAILVSRLHGKVHRAGELRPATVLELLESTDAFRRPQRFERFLKSCEADARGRGPEKLAAPYPQADLLREALTVASAARPDPASLEAATGPQIGERWRAARIEALRNFRERGKERGRPE
jgi:tRNA nucleotidyltransferase (CCA-adding enzyme)